MIMKIDSSFFSTIQPIQPMQSRQLQQPQQLQQSQPVANDDKGSFREIFSNHLNAPLEPLQSSQLQSEAESNHPKGAAIFNDALSNAVSTIKQLSAESNMERTKALLGDADDLHTSIIAGQKSGLAQDMFMQTRNKLIEAYSEIIRIQV